MTRSFRQRRPRGFVLLEVLISLTILAVTISAVLRSLMLSLAAVRRLEVQTQSAFFARQLMDHFEFEPPEEGRSEGGFGDDYRFYSYALNVEFEEPDYDDANMHDEVERYFPMRIFVLEIFYQDERMPEPFRALRLKSAVMGFERFTEQAKNQQLLF